MPSTLPGTISSRRPLRVATLVLAGFVALALGTTIDGFSTLDHHARELVQALRLPWLDPSMRLMTLVGERTGLIPFMFLTMALLWRPRRRWALALPAVMAGAGAVQWVAKWAINRPRPNLAAWGFPSGHVLSVVVLCGVLTYLLCASALPRWSRRLGAVACGAMVVIVGWTRLYLDMHWLSDVAGGFMLGLAYLLPAIWLVDTALVGWSGRPPALSMSEEPVGQLTTTPAVETLSVS